MYRTLDKRDAARHDEDTNMISSAHAAPTLDAAALGDCPRSVYPQFEQQQVTTCVFDYQNPTYLIDYLLPLALWSEDGHF